MAQHIKIPRLEALLDKEKLFERVAAYDQALASELRANDAQLAAYATTKGTEYAFTRDTREVTITCLERNAPKWMRPREVARALAEGGFLMDPLNGPRLIVDSLRRTADANLIQRTEDKEFVAALGVPPFRAEDEHS